MGAFHAKISETARAVLGVVLSNGTVVSALEGAGDSLKINKRKVSEGRIRRLEW